MELRHLRALLRVAEVGSISGAANELHLTQPALSRQIGELERFLGVRLFVRNPHGVHLTEVGRAFRQHADAIVSQVDRTSEVVQVASSRRQPLRVGGPPGLPHHWFRRIVRAVEDAALPVRFSLFEAASDEQRQLLRAGRLDLALLHAEPSEGSCRHVLTQRLGVVVRPGSALASKASVTLFDLDGLTLLAHAAGEIRVQEVRLRSAVEAAGVSASWVFRRFSHHSPLIADLAEADAAMTTEASARINFPEWIWVPVDAEYAGGTPLDIRTWAAWTDMAPAVVSDVVSLMMSDLDRVEATTSPSA